MKIIWICKFSNQEMIQYFGSYGIKESSPWINGLIELFRRNDAVDLHIVAPNVFNNKDLNFHKNRITYHFYRERPVWLNGKLDRYIRWNYRTDFHSVKSKIGRIIENIKPDIIHLHGAENAYYSASILPLLKQYRTMVTIQGFIMDSSPDSLDPYLRRRRIEVERMILNGARHFGIDCDFMEDRIKELNPDTVFHKHQYPVTVPRMTKDQVDGTVEYDCVFFARICKDKGIEDLIKAISLAKKVKPDISLNVIGSVDKVYFNFLKSICHELDVEENIIFSGFFATQELLFQQVLKSEVSVLPTYHDTLPGTVVESMFMKLPVIAYSIGGLPELNSQSASIVLVEKGNIGDLASGILHLLDNKQYRIDLVEKAFHTIYQRIRPDEIVNDIVKAYRQIMSEPIQQN